MIPVLTAQPVLFCVGLDKDTDAYFQAVLRKHALLISAFGSVPKEPDSPLAFLHAGKPDTFREVESQVHAFAPGICGGADGQVVTMQTTEPVTAGQWAWRCAALIATTRTMVYVVDDLSTRNGDLVALISFARMIGALTIGLMPRDIRTMVDTTLLTMTDVVISDMNVGKVLGALLKPVPPP